MTAAYNGSVDCVLRLLHPPHGSKRKAADATARARRSLKNKKEINAIDLAELGKKAALQAADGGKASATLTANYVTIIDLLDEASRDDWGDPGSFNDT